MNKPKATLFQRLIYRSGVQHTYRIKAILKVKIASNYHDMNNNIAVV
jgi:hypothetical protein